MSIKIREATPADIDVIVRYNLALARETESRELDEALLRAGVEALLRDRNKGVYYLAEEDGEVLGQTLVTYEWSDWRNGTFWWIQSVYVTPNHRGESVFGALYRHLHALASNDPTVCGMRLYVDRDNRRAAEIYRALGMKDAHYEMLEVDFRMQR